MRNVVWRLFCLIPVIGIRIAGRQEEGRLLTRILSVTWDQACSCTMEQYSEASMRPVESFGKAKRV